MVREVVAYADRVDPDQRETGTEFIKEIHDLPAGVLPAPGAHRDDPVLLVRTLTNVHHCFSVATADIDSGD
jgi:hypothetical protein